MEPFKISPYVVSKESEESIIKSRKAFEYAQKLGNIGNWEWIANTDSTTWSNQMYSIMEMDSNKPPGRDEERKKYHPDDVDNAFNRMNNVFKTGISDSFETRLLSNKGQ